MTEAKLAGGFAATLASERDRATLAAILRLLPAVVATAARERRPTRTSIERWIASARQMAAAVTLVEAAG